MLSAQGGRIQADCEKQLRSEHRCNYGFEERLMCADINLCRPIIFTRRTGDEIDLSNTL